MDFSYKVIRNRLGSLVANAIQRKIKDSQKIVIIKLNHTSGDATIDYTHSDVLEMFDKGIAVNYVYPSGVFSSVAYNGFAITGTIGSYTLTHRGNTVTISIQ